MSRSAERAVLVHVTLRDKPYRDSWPSEESVRELGELASSSGVEVVEQVSLKKDRPTAGYFVGKGHVEQIHERCHAARGEVVIFGADLNFPQQRNLEDLLGVKVIDRTQLILDIFADRARSAEGRVQVELAQLRYLLPRLAGKGVMLSRLGGGIGTRGPGEQKLEVDRRRIRLRIRKLQEELQEIQARRGVARQRRQQEKVLVAALVGYTNAGKSSLLNALTQAGARSENRLFTTLDPLTRRLLLPNHQPVLLSDTVGFLHHLPHHLVEAFRATLEEVSQSDLLVHVLDASSSLLEEKEAAVREILTEIEAEEKPVLVVLNKCDLLEDGAKKRLRHQYPEAVLVSATQREGLSELSDRLAGILGRQMQEVRIRIPRGREEWVNRVYTQGQVLERRDEGSWVEVHARVPEVLYGQLRKAGFLW